MTSIAKIAANGKIKSTAKNMINDYSKLELGDLIHEFICEFTADDEDRQYWRVQEIREELNRRGKEIKKK
jgi:hypothetical protein